MGSTWGRYFKATTFGESHGEAVGVIVDGVPPGLALTALDIQKELDRRKPGQSHLTTARREPDQAEVLSGLADGATLGTPIAVIVRNRDARSKDYSAIREKFRPGHADYTYFKKYGVPPQPGGGRSSARETVGRTIAGAIAKVFLRAKGIEIFGFTAAVGRVEGKRVEEKFIESNPIRSADPDKAGAMIAEIEDAAKAGDSVGGVVEVRILGAPSGLGNPVFHKLEAELGGAMLSIGAVKGVEFGDGFAMAQMRGSEANDQMSANGFHSNRAGGILGGISSGQEIIIRMAIKPTPSISKKQSTIDLQGNDAEISTQGRHDPCICPRIVPVAESMAALVLVDAWQEHQAHMGMNS